jgi:hypothetical protein
MVHAPSSGSKGGLLLAWRHGVVLECFLTSVNIISVWCYSDPPHQPWILSCIYGPPYHRDKSLFWDNMCSIGDLYDGPWLCIGDFNMILDQNDKKVDVLLPVLPMIHFNPLSIIRVWLILVFLEIHIPGLITEMVLILFRNGLIGA